MRYTAEHKEETRRRLVEAAGSLAKKQGFGTTGVDGLMGAAGMKGSSFYHHFSTKNELLKDIIENELEASRTMLMGEQDGSRQEAIKQTLAYLSMRHLDNPQEGCALPTLSSEVARADDNVKRAFERGLVRIHDDMHDILGDDSKAWSMMALTVGAMVLAGGMASKAKQKRLLKACAEFASQTIDPT